MKPNLINHRSIRDMSQVPDTCTVDLPSDAVVNAHVQNVHSIVVARNSKKGVAEKGMQTNRARNEAEAGIAFLIRVEML